ncbi:hypothetical protein BLS_006354 [Venturia inaequalis]|uniref:Uncharacterized protein n=1 Tax=Venturia inaequalis TaxID=5025 RepID=A0A8H3UCH6_VENIN|nr:hypothetical protein BLS_006354 [Venturia inaequalis]
MQLINLLLAAVLATTALASPKIRFVPHTLKAHCNGNDNDCCLSRRTRIMGRLLLVAMVPTVVSFPRGMEGLVIDRWGGNLML